MGTPLQSAYVNYDSNVTEQQLRRDHKLRRPTTNADFLHERDFALILGSGFMSFYDHAGFLAALTDAHITPTEIRGVSAGAIAGGLYAAGIAVPDMVRIMADLRLRDFMDIGWRDTQSGLVLGNRYEALLQRIFATTGVQRIEDCPLKLSIVAHQVATDQPVVLTQGRITTAIRASSALPILFRPVLHEGEYYVDGAKYDAHADCAVRPHERVFRHLPVGSLWNDRIAAAIGMKIGPKATLPVDPNGQTLQLRGLPQMEPHTLLHDLWLNPRKGLDIINRARAATRRWLQAPRWHAPHHLWDCRRQRFQ